MNANTAEIKNTLHKLIAETDDQITLSKVEAYFKTLRSKDVDWWDTISDKDKEAVEIGLQQLENGKGIAHEEVKRKVNQLFGRK